MIDVQSLTSQIKKNCNISDAKYWGAYSLCGLLLRLRELYRVEKGMRLWEKIQQRDIGEWITERENLWSELENKDFEHIVINGNTYEPFEVEKINTELEKEGLFYGAGFGIHQKPIFFLADLLSKEKVNGFQVHIAGREYARDLSDYPALFQDRTIIARVDTTKLLLWQRFEELRYKGSKNALSFAFSKYGIMPEEEPSEDVERRISLIAHSEAETYIHHELGEAFEGTKIGDEWKAFLISLPHSRAELFARAVKDILSDTSENGMLRYIMKNQKEGSLGFYVVFIGGLRKIIFPEILDAFQVFVKTGDWGFIEDARKSGYRKAVDYTERLLSVYRHHKSEKELIAKYVENEILDRLQ